MVCEPQGLVQSRVQPSKGVIGSGAGGAWLVGPPVRTSVYGGIASLVTTCRANTISPLHHPPRHLSFSTQSTMTQLASRERSEARGGEMQDGS